MTPGRSTGGGRALSLEDSASPSLLLSPPTSQVNPPPPPPPPSTSLPPSHPRSLPPTHNPSLLPPNPPPLPLAVQSWCKRYTPPPLPQLADQVEPSLVGGLWERRGDMSLSPRLDRTQPAASSPQPQLAGGGFRQATQRVTRGVSSRIQATFPFLIRSNPPLSLRYCLPWGRWIHARPFVGASRGRSWNH